MTITKLDGYSLIFQKLSIKCGTTELFINLNATGSQETYWAFLADFLRDRKQKVILNGQSLSLANINAGVPQDPINDLYDNLQCIPKLFADDTFLFFIVKLSEIAADNLNKNSKEINKCSL